MDEKTCNRSELNAAAREFVAALFPSPRQATVVGLYGELGSGKTTFVQCAAQALGVVGAVSSPTFLVMKQYPLTDVGSGSGFRFLVHVDAYRLKNGAELRALRFEELLADRGNLIFVEWADRVADILPPDHIKLRFRFVNNSTRAFSIEGAEKATVKER